MDGGTILVVDTREPNPSCWENYFSLPVTRHALKTGDYSLLGHEDQIAIERKTLDDLVGCLTSSRDRFERELTRATEMKFFVVLVESNFSDLANGRYRSRLNPKSGVESLSAFEVRYSIPFIFCGNQELAARKCESLLLKWEREQKKIEETFPF